MQVLSYRLSAHQTEIVKALLYFDVFKYPLTRDELFENSAIKLSKQQFNKELEDLLLKKLVKEEEGFVSSLERTSSDITRRLKGNDGALKILPTALKYSQKIAKFPFVYCVCISGSLSKNYFDESSDLDYFIITSPNRLWLCRTFLIIYFKLLPAKKKKMLCTNYFITSDSLGIPDVNAFTSTELAHLIPTINYRAYKNLLQKNSWYKNWYPNKSEMPDINCVDSPKSYIKSITEKVLQGKLGNFIDNYLLNVTLKRWRKKFPEYSDADFELQFRSRKDVCKRHTKGFQNKVLVLWEEKLKAFEHTTNPILNT
jgi:hypothetical protein